MGVNGVRRTAVTGIGVVAPGGVTREAFWEQITAGRTATPPPWRGGPEQ